MCRILTSLSICIEAVVVRQWLFLSLFAFFIDFWSISIRAATINHQLLPNQFGSIRFESFFKIDILNVDIFLFRYSTLRVNWTSLGHLKTSPSTLGRIDRHLSQFSNIIMDETNRLFKDGDFLVIETSLFLNKFRHKNKTPCLKDSYWSFTTSSALLSISGWLSSVALKDCLWFSFIKAANKLLW